MRYTGVSNRVLRSEWVIVDDTIRGRDYGKQMLRLEVFIGENCCVSICCIR